MTGFLRPSEAPCNRRTRFMRSNGEEIGSMSSNSKTKISTKRRVRKFAWLFAATSTVCALLYWEQTALLYVLSVLAMCGLLLIVAFSNLESRDQEWHAAAAEDAVDARSDGSSDLVAPRKWVA